MQLYIFNTSNSMFINGGTVKLSIFLAKKKMNIVFFSPENPARQTKVHLHPLIAPIEQNTISVTQTTQKLVFWRNFCNHRNFDK